MIQLLQQSLTKKLFGFATRIGMFWILLGISQAHFLSRNYLNITNLKICTLDNLILHTWNNANRDIKSEYTSYSKVRLKYSKRCEFEPFCHRKKVHLIWMCNKQFSAITMWKLQWFTMYIRYLLRFFDCLAHPNLSATFATDQKWPLCHLRISYQSLAGGLRSLQKSEFLKLIILTFHVKKWITSGN